MLFLHLHFRTRPSSRLIIFDTRRARFLLIYTRFSPTGLKCCHYLQHLGRVPLTKSYACQQLFIHMCESDGFYWSTDNPDRNDGPAPAPTPAPVRLGLAVSAWLGSARPVLVRIGFLSARIGSDWIRSGSVSAPMGSRSGLFRLGWDPYRVRLGSDGIHIGSVSARIGSASGPYRLG
jgi:hypothetical protein